VTDVPVTVYEPRVAVGWPAGERRDKPAWRRDLRTSYIEGVAIHDDLESCVGAREDAGEALTEGDVGSDLLK
jgi:hypothetical protein